MRQLTLPKPRTKPEADAPRPRPRWVGVGRSGETNSEVAGERAAAAAVTGPEPRLLVVFASNQHTLQPLLDGVRRTCPGVPLIGCSTAGEIASDGPGDAGVVVAALGGPGFTVATGYARDAAGRLREAGAEVASVGAPGEGAYQVLLLLTDGLAGNQEEVVRGAYSVVGARVPLVGGCAGDDLKMEKTFQFHGGEVLTGALVSALITSDGPIGIGVRHGWGPVGEAMLVTGSSDTRVYSLDGKPALDVYLERLDAPLQARRDPATFTRFAMTHPLGLRRRTAEDVRFVADANFEDRSLGFIARVPQGAMTWIMEGDDESVLDATDAACSAAVAQLLGHKPLGFLAFDCIARRGVLGEPGIRREVERISATADNAPVAGFYTYGEIARTSGVGGFHNQTLVILALS
ncbi:MAG: FIST signal transduction protein [Candidatus Dormibacteria bacterium]